MQNPTSEEGALIKREWWRPWEHEELPPLEHVIQSTIQLMKNKLPTTVR